MDVDYIMRYPPILIKVICKISPWKFRWNLEEANVFAVQQSNLTNISFLHFVNAILDTSSNSKSMTLNLSYVLLG